MLGLENETVFRKLLSTNLSESYRMEAVRININLFSSSILNGIGIDEAYVLAENFSDTSTSTFLLAKYGIFHTLFKVILPCIE